MNKDTLALGIILVIFTIAILFTTQQPRGKVYDCRLAEISPDYPLEVKEECRKMNAKKTMEDMALPKKNLKI